MPDGPRIFTVVGERKNPSIIGIAHNRSEPVRARDGLGEPDGTRDAFVMGFRVQRHMCNPAGGLHGGMMMTVADLVAGMGGSTLAGIRNKFMPTVNMTFDFVAPAKAGDWVEGRAEVVRQTRSLLFTNIYLTVGEEKFLRASQIAKIPSGDGLAFGKARLDRGKAGSSVSPPR